MHRTIPCLFASTLLSFAFFGCSQAPIEELEQTEAVIADARALEADRYAAQPLAEAEAALEAARLEIEGQGERFVLGRSYQKADELLAEAKLAAEEARDAAVAGREQARRDAEEALARAERALTEAQAAIEQAPGGKGTERDLARMRTELQEAASALEAASAHFEAGDYASARSRAEAIRDRTMSIVADITKAQKKST